MKLTQDKIRPIIQLQAQVAGNLWTSTTLSSFSRKTLNHGISRMLLNVAFIIETLMRWMVRWWMNDKLEGFRRKQSWHDRASILEFVWKHWRTLRKTSVKIAGVPTQIWTEHLSNTSLERYIWTTLLGLIHKLVIIITTVTITKNNRKSRSMQNLKRTIYHTTTVIHKCCWE